MALLKCPDCDKEISTRAYFCPNCGRLTSFGYPAFITLGIAGSLIAIAAVTYLFSGVFGG